MTRNLLIASQNVNKITQLQPLLEKAGFVVTDARSLKLPEPEEDSGTFIGNARIKAKAAVEATGMAVLADDSGLVVEALGEFPGVDSAPYAKSLGGYEAAIKDIFKRLNGRPADCYYISTIMVMFPDGREVVGIGKVHGCLLETPRGDNHFGYDPWFLVDGGDKTFGEMTLHESVQISHRGRALDDLMQKLEGCHDLRAVS